ncbi:g11626 [Coccomyxa elongata]
MGEAAVGELYHNPKSESAAATAKAHIAAKYGGMELLLKADETLNGSVELRASTGSLNQANAIARFIAITTSSGLYPLPPYSSEKRQLAGTIDAWIDFSTAEALRILQQVRSASSQQEIEIQTQILLRSLAGLEKQLQTSTFLVGNAVTLADVVLCCDLQYAFEKVLDASARESIPSIVRWFQTVLHQPKFASVLGPVTLASAPLEAPKAAKKKGSEAGAKPKDSKKPAKENKPKQAPKKAVANGPAVGGKGDKKKETKLGLSASKKDDFGNWYSEAVIESEMISYYDVSGCYILRPNSFAIWEAITAFFDKGIKALGVQNAYFPLFVTEDALNTEKNHVEGFAAEVAWVTKSGQSELDRPIAIRPTSETVMYPYYAQWIRSHRDLPLRLNQWTNVVRWEFKHPTPFIRTREFLWQEGHTAFATQAEAEEEVLQILDLYAKVYTDLLAVPVYKGKKSAKEKFAGALYTTSVEAFVPATGRGVQGATSHCLGQNFSKMFKIEFETDDGGKQFAWQNSWGLSTRTIGVMIMVHGDDKGIVMPPRVAPLQVIIIPIPAANLTDAQRSELSAKTAELAAQLRAAGVRVQCDDRDNYRPGWKYNHWEVKGVPIRLELGSKDMEKKSAVLARRDNGAKEVVPLADVAVRIPALLEEIHADMYARSSAEFEECKETATTWDDFMAALDRKHMVLAPWADEEEIEDEVRKRSATADAMGAKTLCIPLEQPDLPPGTKCFVSGKPAKNWALWGRSY